MFAKGKVSDAIELADRQGVTPLDRSHWLDIGCGVGVAHGLMAPRVGQLTGVDVSAEAIAIAQSKNGGVDYHVADSERLPFDDASFDCSTTMCVMHHVQPQQWESFVAEAWRVTKPGGLFAVYEHNPINPMTRWAVWRCPFDHDAVLLRARKVIRLLEQQGFEIVTQRYLFFVPIDRPWARRVDRWLRWLPLGAQYVVCGRRPEVGESTGAQHPA